MRRVLFDTNVLLDVLLEREPHHETSAAALELVARGEVEGFLAAHAVTTLAYLLERETGAARTRALLTELLARMRVAAVTEAVVHRALASELRDFEDAVCVAAAEEAGIAVIVTRNLKDFAGSRVPALPPTALLPP